MSLLDLSLAEARAQLRQGEISAEALTRAYIEAITATEELNLYVTRDFEAALEAARVSDSLLGQGKGRALEGIPVGVKDLFCTQGVRTTAASRILGDFCPPYESHVSGQLRQAGAVMLGKLNMDEFAMGSTTSFSRFGASHNPWRSSTAPESPLVPGGSSGASAAAIACRAALGTLGTDTGGSIRQPAAFCGVVGIKPTYGRCSRWGIIAFASSLDQAGVFGRTVQDAALLLETVMGHDPRDSTCAPRDVPALGVQMPSPEPSLQGKTIGIPRQYRIDGTDSDIVRLWEQGEAWLKDAGARVVSVDLPHTSAALPAYYIIAPAEASSNLARFDGVRYGARASEEGDDLNALYTRTRGAGFGPEVRRRLLIGTYVLSQGYYDAYYTKALKVRRLIADDFHAAFQACDALLTPTTPSAAFSLQDDVDPVTLYLNDIFTVPASLAGLPGISVPAGTNSHGLPLGLQLIGRPFDERGLLHIAAVLESCAAFTAAPFVRAH